MRLGYHLGLIYLRGRKCPACGKEAMEARQRLRLSFRTYLHREQCRSCGRYVGLRFFNQLLIAAASAVIGCGSAYLLMIGGGLALIAIGGEEARLGLLQVLGTPGGKAAAGLFCALLTMIAIGIFGTLEPLRDKGDPRFTRVTARVNRARWIVLLLVSAGWIGLNAKLTIREWHGLPPGGRAFYVFMMLGPPAALLALAWFIDRLRRRRG